MFKFKNKDGGNMPKISVIMGIYNGADTMDEAIRSICNQSYEDWELIVCDDCSTDNTVEKMEKWCSEDNRIKLVKNEKNMGLAATLNHCLKYANGIYIARMDDDDISYPERFSEQIDFLMNNQEFAFVSSIVDCYDGKQMVRNRFLRKAEPQKKDFLSGTQFVHPASMFRKECLAAVQGYREGRVTKRVEDYDLFMRLYAAGYKGYNIQKPLLRYTVNIQGMKRKNKYIYRIDEARIRYLGFKGLGLLPMGIPYVLRPLIVGLIPKQLIWRLFYKDYR